MRRYWVRSRSPRSAPWPDNIPGQASAADRWRYVYVRAVRPVVALNNDERDALTVLILFCRYNAHRRLTRLFIERQHINDFHGIERRRILAARDNFIRELCHRGLLAYPRKHCRENIQGGCPRNKV